MIKIGKNTKTGKRLSIIGNGHNITIGDNVKINGVLTIHNTRKSIKVVIKNNVRIDGSVDISGNVEIEHSCLLNGVTFTGYNHVGYKTTIKHTLVGNQVKIHNNCHVHTGVGGIIKEATIENHSKVFGPILSWPSIIGAYKTTQIMKSNNNIISMYYDEYFRKIYCYITDRNGFIIVVKGQTYPEMVLKIAEQYKNTIHESIIRDYL